MSYGAQTKLAIARQASAGTAVIAPTSYHGLAFVTEDVGLEIEELISQNLIGRFEEGAAYDGISRIAGTIEMELTPRNLAAGLAAVFNHTPAQVTSASVNAYTFLPNTQDFSSFFCKAPWSIYKQFSDATSGELFYDCQFSQAEFVYSTGAFTRGRVTVVGGTRTATGIGSMSVLPDVADVTRLFPWNVCSVSYGGTGLSNMSEITVSLNENIAALNTLNGTLAPFKFTRTAPRQVSVNGTFYMSDRLFLNNFAASSLGRLIVTAMNTRAAIQSGYFHTFTLDVPQAKITAFKPSASGPGEVAVPFTMRGTIDPSSAYAIQATLTTTWAVGF
jgi:hypothetical protein